MKLSTHCDPKRLKMGFSRSGWNDSNGKQFILLRSLASCHMSSQGDWRIMQTRIASTDKRSTSSISYRRNPGHILFAPGRHDSKIFRFVRRVSDGLGNSAKILRVLDVAEYYLLILNNIPAISALNAFSAFSRGRKHRKETPSLNIRASWGILAKEAVSLVSI